SKARSVVTVAVVGVSTAGPGPLNWAKHAGLQRSATAQSKEMTSRRELLREGGEIRALTWDLHCVISDCRATPNLYCRHRPKRSRSTRSIHSRRSTQAS